MKNDRLTEEQKAEAEKVFVELKEAYDQHDLEKVKRILTELESGNSFHSQSDTISEKQLLKSLVKKLRQKLQQLEQEIIAIKESETFSIINIIADWDIYFNETKAQLEHELQSLTLELQS